MPLLGLGTFVGALVVLWRVGLVLTRPPPPPSLSPPPSSPPVTLLLISSMSLLLFCLGCPLVPFVGVGLHVGWPRELPCLHPASRAVAPQRRGLFPDRLYIHCHSSRCCTPCCLPPPVPLPSVASLGVVIVLVLPSPLPLLSAAGWGVAPKAYSRGDVIEVVHLIFVLFCF